VGRGRSHYHTASIHHPIKCPRLETTPQTPRNADHSRPHILLILVARPHRLDNLLALRLGHFPVLGDELAEQNVDLARHVGRVAADVEVGLLLKELVDLLAVFFN
jgi:hypothetical protein